MRIGTFYTLPLDRDGETGFLEFDLDIPSTLIMAHGSSRDYIMHRIAETLAGLCARHQTPKDLWYFKPSDPVRRLTELPEVIPF